MHHRTDRTTYYGLCYNKCNEKYLNVSTMRDHITMDTITKLFLAPDLFNSAHNLC